MHEYMHEENFLVGFLRYLYINLLTEVWQHAAVLLLSKHCVSSVLKKLNTLQMEKNGKQMEMIEDWGKRRLTNVAEE